MQASARHSNINVELMTVRNNIGISSEKGRKRVKLEVADMLAEDTKEVASTALEFKDSDGPVSIIINYHKR